MPAKRLGIWSLWKSERASTCVIESILFVFACGQFIVQHIKDIYKGLGLELQDEEEEEQEDLFFSPPKSLQIVNWF